MPKLHGFLVWLLTPLLLSLATTIAVAADVSFPELADKIPGHPAITYLDLAKLIVPDLAKVAAGYQGHVVIDLRHFDGPDSSEKPPETIVNPGIASMPIRVGGRDRLLVLIDLGESEYSVADFAVLALYDVSARPLLLDAADVGYDRSSYFRDPATLAVAEGTDAIVTMSTHFNSSQGYVTSALILPRNDRFELIDTVFTFDEKTCAFERAQNPVFKVLAASPAGFAPIEATVTETTTPGAPDCGDEVPEPATRTITVTYKWDDAASRYVPDSDAFDKLAAENEKRF
jgi:hypothetical protein